MVEKPKPEKAPSNLAVLGRYILPSKVMDLLEQTEVGIGGEIQLTDALDKLLKIQGLNALETDAEVYDFVINKVFCLQMLLWGCKIPKPNIC